MNQLKNLAGDTFWYGLSSIVGRIISYLLTPLYTTVFLPGEYGVVTELYGYVAFLNIVFMYGLETAYFRFATREPDHSANFFNTTVSSIIVSTLVISGALVLSAGWIVDALGYSGQENIIYWLAAIIAIDTLAAIPFAQLRLSRKPKRFAFIKLTNIITTIFLNIFFLVICRSIHQGEYLADLKPFVGYIYDHEFAIKYVFLSNLLANLLYVFLLFDQFKNFNFDIKKNTIKPILIYSLPLLFMGLAAVTNDMLSRVLLKYLLPDGFYPGQTSLYALGIFGACYKLSVFMTLGIQAFRYAAEPFFFSNAKNKNSPELFSSVMHGFVIFNAIVFLAISVNLEPLGNIFLRTEAYREGLYIVPFLLSGGLFLGVYYNLSLWFKVTDKTIYGAYITLFGAAITIILNVILIPIAGYFGSAIATAITYLSMVLFSYFLGRKFYPIPYKVLSGVTYVGLAGLLAYLFYSLDLGGFWANVFVRNLSVIGYIIFVYIKERKHLKGQRLGKITLP